MWGGALKVGDLSLLEDGGERGGALVSNATIAPETADEGGAEMVRDSKRVNGR